MAEGRRLYWNMACPVLMLAAGVLLLSLTSHTSRATQRLKQYPSDQSGLAKTFETVGVQVPTVVTYLPRTRPVEEASKTYPGPLSAATDRLVLNVSSFRYRFMAYYSESGSNIDSEVRFRHLRDILLYLPRAFEIGWWAPFPRTWADAGRRVGSAGKLLSGAETLLLYVFELLALAAVFRPPHRLAAWLLFSVSAFGLTLLGLVVPNVGALYRFRYTFWVLLVILGAKGLKAAVAAYRERRGGLLGGVAAGVSMACLLAVAGACSARAVSNEGPAGVASRAPETTTPEGADGGRMGFDLNNFTGRTLRAVYVSPSVSEGWEENVLGRDKLNDSDVLELRFNPEESTPLWDLRIESGDDHYAVWKGLDLRGVSRITLLLDTVGKPAAVAEVE